MPHYRIEIIPLRENEPGGGAGPDQEMRRFANLGDALQRAREMYRRHETAAKGLRARSLSLYGCYTAVSAAPR
jgi:hypothetical protein